MKGREDVFHSPDWYRERCFHDKVNIKANMMLKTDCAEYYDSKAIPEEFVDLYEDRWNSPDFK